MDHPFIDRFRNARSHDNGALEWTDLPTSMPAGVASLTAIIGVDAPSANTTDRCVVMWHGQGTLEFTLGPEIIEARSATSR